MKDRSLGRAGLKTVLSEKFGCENEKKKTQVDSLSDNKQSPMSTYILRNSLEIMEIPALNKSKTNFKYRPIILTCLFAWQTKILFGTIWTSLPNSQLAQFLNKPVMAAH